MGTTLSTLQEFCKKWDYFKKQLKWYLVHSKCQINSFSALNVYLDAWPLDEMPTQSTDLFALLAMETLLSWVCIMVTCSCAHARMVCVSWELLQTCGLYPTLHNLSEEGGRCSILAGSVSNWASQASSVGSGSPPQPFTASTKQDGMRQMAPCPLPHLHISS